MIQIDELAIELPYGLEHRASRIAQLAREKSGRLQVGGQRSMDELALPDIEIDAGADNDRIADLIVARLEQVLEERG